MASSHKTVFTVPQEESRMQETLATWLCTDCESKQKAFLERLSSRFPYSFQLPMPDPPHNIKSVPSAIFWYWVFLDNRLINLTMLLVIRGDRDSAVSSTMKIPVTIKALKNKDRVSVETAVEVLSHALWTLLFINQRGLLSLATSLLIRS